MKEKYITESILINASSSKVWQALTDPIYTQKYMYSCVPETDWEPSSKLIWRGVNDGVVYVTGHVIKCDPQSLLIYSTIDPNGKYGDTEANHLQVTYSLEEKENSTLLRINQGDYNQVEKGAERYDESMSYGGWGGIIKRIKQIAEEI